MELGLLVSRNLLDISILVGNTEDDVTFHAHVLEEILATQPKLPRISLPSPLDILHLQCT